MLTSTSKNHNYLIWTFAAGILTGIISSLVAIQIASENNPVFVRQIPLNQLMDQDAPAVAE